jgi:hypothetical protein
VKSLVINLDAYRWNIQQGNGTIVGQETLPDGRAALKLELDADEIVSGTVYLDPDTLFPLVHDMGPGGRVSITYPTIETLSLDAMPVELFEVQSPDVNHTYLRQQLSEDDLARFNDYAVWGLDVPWLDYTLQDISRLTVISANAPTTDQITLMYATPDAENVIQIESMGPNSLAWDARQSKHNPDAEQVTIRGETGWLTVEGDSNARLEFVWRNVYLTIHAPDRETAISVAETIRQLYAPGMEPEPL